MKINRLKFKQITSLISKKDLKLDLFNTNSHLFQPQNDKPTQSRMLITSRTNLSRNQAARTARSQRKNKYRNLSYCRSRRANPLKQQDSIYHLGESLLNYLDCISIDQCRAIRKQLEVIRDILKCQKTKDIINGLINIQAHLSNLFKNRLIHLTFYLVFNKMLSSSKTRKIQLQIKNSRFIQYYSRKFNFKELSLAICIEIQGLFLQNKDYQQSRQYARKSLRLAVVLGDSYNQAKMIDRLNILNYYQGRLNKQNNDFLSADQRKRIIQGYNQEQEIPKIFKFQCKDDSKEQFQQFPLQRNNNFIQTGQQNRNIKYFKSNYHDIVKNIDKNNTNLRKVMKRVQSVGVLKKYFNKDNFIEIKPQCLVIKCDHQEQVLVTHNKNKPPADDQIATKKTVRRLLGMLENTITCYKCRI